MSSGRYPEEADPEGLYTSEDLFGDMVDATSEAPPEPAAARPSPIRVQISEPGPPRDDEGLVSDKPEMMPEDVAILLEAFADPLEERAVALPQEPDSPAATG